MSIEITGPTAARKLSGLQEQDEGRRPRLVIPGMNVSTAANFMRGHGTYLRGDELIASLAGAVETVNKLICVRPLKSRYFGEVGDVVIGRITEVQQKRWKVDTNSMQDATLMLASVNLPGGELRRKSAEDELMMKEYLNEGDLISAEVQKVASDGSLHLHTRSLRYGKLSQGVLAKVSPFLIKRRKTHFHDLPCGASIILGCNGYIWISPIVSDEQNLTGGYAQNLDEVIDPAVRQVIARLANCVDVLAKNCIPLYDTSIMYAYENSLSYPVKDLLNPNVASEISAEVLTLIEEKIEEC
ncbi:hypothetical protein AB6A40_008921 [Gnathostoma spinigerum]|uniref:Ribosomal RNA-processing protein 4 n=1 Tax=Gnathostoma spinigerum TaxID=75299 RepID=A0ABD6ESV2_9BILA